MLNGESGLRTDAKTVTHTVRDDVKISHSGTFL